MYRKKSPAEACHPLKLNMPKRLKPCRARHSSMPMLLIPVASCQAMHDASPEPANLPAANRCHTSRSAICASSCARVGFPLRV